MRILVVDDDNATRVCLAKILSPAGEVVSVADGKEALEALAQALEEESPYQLVCMDICMPKLDGLEALKALRALESRHPVPAGQEAKVVMVSSCDDTGSVCDAYFHGLADGYVKKPVRMTSFWDELKRLGLFIPETHSHTG